MKVKIGEVSEPVTIQYNKAAKTFKARIQETELEISDSINLADPVIRLTVNGTPHVLQLISRNAVGKIELQYLGSVFPLHVYHEDVHKYLHWMPAKKVADTSRQV